MTKHARISYQLPEVPYSLRALIERAAKERSVMMCLSEDPIMALRANGVRFSEECLTQKDCIRLVTVIGKLHTLVESGKVARDFRFEDVFTIAENVSYRSSNSESSTSCSTEFTPKVECFQTSHTEQGQEQKWQGFGLPGNIDPRWITAPMLSPGDLRQIITTMDQQIDVIA